MKLSPRTWILVGVAVAVAFAGFGYCQRRRGVAIGKQDQQLETNAGQVKELKAQAVVVRAQTIAKRKEYHAARAKVEVKGDTVIADGQSIELPSVANLVRAADATVAQDSVDRAKQDTLVAALGKRVDLLEEIKRPRCGRKCGAAIGVVGTVGVVYVAVRIIRAVGHR